MVQMITAWSQTVPGDVAALLCCGRDAPTTLRGDAAAQRAERPDHTGRPGAGVRGDPLQHRGLRPGVLPGGPPPLLRHPRPGGGAAGSFVSQVRHAAGICHAGGGASDVTRLGAGSHGPCFV